MDRRVRIDRLLVERGLFESRTQAQSAIAAGRVRADELVIARPSEEISADAVLRAEPAHPYVSRGGVKLAAALDHFRSDAMFNPRGRVCLDVGASTGGFTEILLARGARRVYAVDVGRDQLHRRLRGRPEVVSLEATDIRALDPARLARLDVNAQQVSGDRASKTMALHAEIYRTALDTSLIRNATLAPTKSRTHDSTTFALRDRNSARPAARDPGPW